MLKIELLIVDAVSCEVFVVTTLVTLLEPFALLISEKLALGHPFVFIQYFSAKLEHSIGTDIEILSSRVIETQVKRKPFHQE